MKKKIHILLALSLSTQVLLGAHPAFEDLSDCRRGSATACLKVSKQLIRNLRKKLGHYTRIEYRVKLIHTLSSGCSASGYNNEQRKAKQECCRLEKIFP